MLKSLIFNFILDDDDLIQTIFEFYFYFLIVKYFTQDISKENLLS